jgi:tRNA (guanine10-N2)-methyltransferase
MLYSKLTRQIGFSRARPLIAKHDIKQRTFYGNTSMEAEMGFLMAGQALVSPLIGTL